jgi:hypothetical protein
MADAKKSVAAAPVIKELPFTDFSKTADGQIWKSMGIPLCKKCGHKKISEVTGPGEFTLRCPNNLPDCEFIK